MPFVVLDRLSGLEAGDRLMDVLARASRRPVPERLRRQRSRLVDAMLDSHFSIGGRRLALAGEPDLVAELAGFVTEVGAKVSAAVVPTQSPVLAGLPAERVVVGDFDDLESAAAGSDLILSSSHGRRAAARLGIPLLRIGFPVFDWLGAAHRRCAGYRGSRDLLFEIGNILMERNDHAPAHTD